MTTSQAVDITISQRTARRYVLGRQGLWPARRWQGLMGCVEALRMCQAFQVDPLSPAARSHEIALWGRVLDVRREYLDDMLYHQRNCFEYGGGIFIYPLEEFPVWQLAMQRRRQKGYWADFGREHAPLIQSVREHLRNMPLANRDFKENKSTQNYRGRRDTSLALNYLWITGEAVIHHRVHNQKVYALAEQSLPPNILLPMPEAHAEEYLALKSVAFRSLISARAWKNSLCEDIRQQISSAEAETWLTDLREQQKLLVARIPDQKESYYFLASDLPVLEQLEKNIMPSSWGDSTSVEPEAILLAPLEIVSARGRAKTLFEFDYVWEVYKPAHLRRWGCYTLPILYGDELVARIDLALNKKSSALVVNGFWLENIRSQPEFVAALGRCLARFARFVDAFSIDASGCTGQPLLKSAVMFANKVLA